MAGQSLLLLVLGFQILRIAGYGFKYPRGSDQLHLGQLINITWDTADEYVDLYLSGGYFAERGLQRPDILIAKNITNSGWFQWQIPSDLSSDLSSACSIRLLDATTEMGVLSSEYLWLQPDPIYPVTSTSTWGKFTTPTGAPETSLRDQTTLNITWETQAQFVSLTYWSEANAPDSIFETQKNPGYYLWTVDDLTSHSLPMYLSLQSNETEYSDTEVVSGGFYVQPSDYPSTKIKSSVGLNGRFLYPTTKDTTTIKFNDTMTFLWDPPVPQSWDLVMVLVTETSSVRPNSLPGYALAEYRPTTYNTTSMTWRMAYFDTFPVDTPYHFNLLVNATTSSFQSARFIYRSETFTMELPTGPETTWTPPADGIALATGRPATTSSSSPSSTGKVVLDDGSKGLALSTKLSIGIGVPFGIVLILLAFLVWLLRKRRAEDRTIHRSISQNGRKGELDAAGPRAARRHELGIAGISPRRHSAPAASRAQLLGIVGSPAPSHNSRRYEVHGDDGAAELA